MNPTPIEVIESGGVSVNVRRDDLYVDQLPVGIDLQGVEFDTGRMVLDPPQTGMARGILSHLKSTYEHKTILYVIKRLDFSTIMICRILAYYAPLVGKQMMFLCPDDVYNAFHKPGNRDLRSYLIQAGGSIHIWEDPVLAFILNHDFKDVDVFNARLFADQLIQLFSYEVQGLCRDDFFGGKGIRWTIVVPIREGIVISGIIDGLMQSSTDNISVIGVLTKSGSINVGAIRRLICGNIPSLLATPWCMKNLTLMNYSQMEPANKAMKNCPFPTDPQHSLRVWSTLTANAMSMLDRTDKFLFWNTSS